MFKSRNLILSSLQNWVNIISDISHEVMTGVKYTDFSNTPIMDGRTMLDKNPTWIEADGI